MLLFPFKLVRNEYIMKKILNKFNNFASNIENKVYIFQAQFYDLDGIACFNGGAERYVLDLANILKAKGYNPILVQEASKSTQFWYKEYQNLKVIGLFSKCYTKALNYLPKPKFVIYSGFYKWKNKLFHPNVLISHGVTWDDPKNQFNIKLMGDVILKDTDFLVSVDTNTFSHLRTLLKKQVATAKTKYVYLPNYVDTKKFFPIEKSNDRTQIIFPRRCLQARGFFLINDVLPLILKKYNFVDFTFIGYIHTNEIKEKINKLMEEHPGRVNHVFVNPDEMHNVYKSADITLVPTLYSEGTSLSCLESMACGNIVIATNIGGLPNLIINKYNGILINPNAEELLNALDKVLNDKELQYKIKNNAVSVSKTFDKEIWINSWENIIEQMTGDKHE